MNQIIKKIINDWNPIEIYPLLEDEYSTETERIIEFIEGKDEIDFLELADFLEKTLVDAFGSNLYSNDRKKCEEASIKILNIVLKNQQQK